MLDLALFRPVEAAPLAPGEQVVEFWTINRRSGVGNVWCLKKWGLTAGGGAELLETHAVATNLEDVRALIPDGKANIKTLFLDGVEQTEPMRFADPTIREVWL